MLAAWMRMKYPHVIAGAHAASAPILFFPGSVSPYAFNDLATRSYKDAVQFCDVTVSKGFIALNNWSNDTKNYANI